MAYHYHNDSASEKQPIVALLVDDQPALAGAMNDILRTAPDIQLSVCQEPSQAISNAVGLGATIILQDLKMPGMDGLSLLRQFRAHPETTQIPVVVLSGNNDPCAKAQAFALGAADYIVKLPNRVELIARIRHHALGHRALVQKNEAFKVLAKRERHLAHEIGDAANYFRSLIPAPLKEHDVRVESRLVPSGQLGGDVLGYHWLSHNHLALYMVDVSGHGVEASLLAVSILNTIRHHTLSGVDFHNPAAVLSSLNRVFRMDQHAQHYFTIWYGVYARIEQRVTFASGGHPPPLLLELDSQAALRVEVFPRGGVPIGMEDEAIYQNMTRSIPTRSRLIIYSDGAIELNLQGYRGSDAEAFKDFVTEMGLRDDLLDQILAWAKRMRGSETLDDDCSLLQVDFPQGVSAFHGIP